MRSRLTYPMAKFSFFTYQNHKCSYLFFFFYRQIEVCIKLQSQEDVANNLEITRCICETQNVFFFKCDLDLDTTR